MVKKIICPTDFSQSANNASEYAASLAKFLNAELLLVNVQPALHLAPSPAITVNEDRIEGSRMAAERLSILSNEITKKYGVKTSYESEITTSSVDRAISALAEDGSLIVMGSNGADKVNQYFFGTNTYNIVKKAKCPVLMVPENEVYKDLKKIVFAWDYSKKNKFSFSFLHDLMKAYHPQFVFLHVSRSHAAVSKEVFRALQDEVDTELGESQDICFKQLVSADIPECIDDYMTNNDADLLTITFYNRSSITDIFHGAVTRRLCEIAGYPILFLHA